MAGEVGALDADRAQADHTELLADQLRAGKPGFPLFDQFGNRVPFAFEGLQWG